MQNKLAELADYLGLKYNQLADYKNANTPRNTRQKVSPGKVFDEGLVNPNRYNAQLANRFKDSALGLAGIVPGVGDYASGVQAADYFNRGEKGNALLAGLGALPIVPSLVAAGATLGGLGVMNKVAQKIGTPLPAGPARKQAGAIVYHGSPHNFDQFDMSKIGTGEGAQAYGHGLYFAEAPDVAKSYADVLSKPSSAIGNIANGAMEEAKNNKELAISNLRKYLTNEQDSFASSGNKYNKKTMEQIEQAIKHLSDPAPGAFYKVDIPDESIPRMLDWDKPLSEQHPDVQAALEKYANSSILENQPKPLRGGDVYSSLRLGEFDNDAAASAMLKQAGIPGIRYLDGSSRTAGQGTSNYVLFDDQLPRILEKNGQPTGLKPWSEDAIGLNGKPIDPRGKVRKASGDVVEQVAPPYLSSPGYPRMDLPEVTYAGQGDTFAGYPTLAMYQAKLAADAAQASRIGDAYRNGDSLTARYGIGMDQNTLKGADRENLRIAKMHGIPSDEAARERQAFFDALNR